jgi:hypothetical protein
MMRQVFIAFPHYFSVYFYLDKVEE